MQLDDTLLTVFTASLDEQDGTPVIQIPEREFELGTVDIGDTYQIAVLEGPDEAGETSNNASGQSHQEPVPESETPVSEGEELEVEIEGVGEKGDGIARVGPGYIVFVPDTEIGDRVTIQITQVRENFGFGEVVTPEPVTG